MERIIIIDGVEIPAPWPVVLLSESRTMVASDIHLGLDKFSSSLGVYIPGDYMNEIQKNLLTPAAELSPRRIILLGDLKSYFGESNYENKHIQTLILALEKVGGSVEVVLGNHDHGNIEKIMRAMGVKVHETHTMVDSFLLAHGHRYIEPPPNCRGVIIGHDHPAVVLKDGLGVRHRYKAFIRIPSAPPVIVLPATTPFTVGTPFNEERDYMSPFIDPRKIRDAVPYVLETNVLVKEFPRLGDLDQ